MELLNHELNKIYTGGNKHYKPDTFHSQLYSASHIASRLLTQVALALGAIILLNFRALCTQ